MLDLLSEDVRRDPFPFYASVRAASPVLELPGTPLWAVLDHASVQRALTDHDSFSSRAVPPTGRAPDWLIFSDPPRHSKLRALVQRAFLPRAIAALEPRIREVSRALLDGVGPELDLVGDYAALLPLRVIAELLGIPADVARLGRWSEAILGLVDSVFGGERAARSIQEHAVAFGEMQGYLSGLLDERRAAPRDDLLSRLVHAEVEGERLSTADILGFFQLLLIAGTETTTNLITLAVLTLLERPHDLVRLRAEPRLLPLAIEEVLRFRSPVQVVFRQTRREVELGGRTIPAARLVLVTVGAANRDPAAFDRADTFDLARDPNPHLAFGHGPHVCLGAALARLEGRVALEHLLGLRGLTLASSEPWEPRRPFHVHGPARLRVRFER